MTALDNLRLFTDVLTLCKLQAHETLVVLSEIDEQTDYATAFLKAAQSLGAPAFQLAVSKRVAEASGRRTTSLSGNEPAVNVLKAADLVIDLVGLLWSSEQKEIQEAGTRILMCREPIEVIARMFPTPDLRRRVESAERRLSAAREMRIVSAAGTDVTYRLGTYPVITQYGYTDQAGRWDNLPGGFLFTGASDDGVDGTVVIGVGDIIFPFKRYIANPIKLVIEKGFVRSIEGTHLDAELLRSYMARWNDPNAYAISHIGWGMDEKAQWDFLASSPLASRTMGVDGRSFYGNVLFSTGPNSELGGSNSTGCHLDIPLRGCSLFLDGEAILTEGKIMPDNLRVPGR
jgi:2,5-dihydroxypyridine 5,6-dioxygenase